MPLFDSLVDRLANAARRSDSLTYTDVVETIGGTGPRFANKFLTHIRIAFALIRLEGRGARVGGRPLSWTESLNELHAFFTRENAENLCASLRRLAEPDRELLEYYVAYAVSVEQVATEYAITVVEATTRLEQAVQVLRADLARS